MRYSYPLLHTLLDSKIGEAVASKALFLKKPRVFEKQNFLFGIVVVWLLVLFSTSSSAQTTINKTVAAATDDGEEAGTDATGTYFNGKMDLTSSDIELGEDHDISGGYSSGTQKSGLRFTGITIPKGATITSAYLTFRAVAADAPNTNTQTTNLTIRGHLTANSSTFTTTNFDISNRTTTTASVAWSSVSSWTTGTDYNSPSIVGIIQEIVSQGSWASGNALSIIINGTGHRSSQSYNTAPANAAQLTITYSVPTPTTSVTSATSCSSTNGAIDLTVTGGTSPYTYLWSNGATTQDLSGVAASSYTVTVTDNSGVTVTTSASTLPNLITNGMNASDLLGQYTTTSGFTNSYTQATIHNNNGSVYALGLRSPSKYLVDAVNNRAFVADGANNRVLVYNLDASNNLVDKTPDFVLGQANFTTSTAAVTQAGMNTPVDLAYDATNNRLFVVQSGAHRVTVYDVASITNGENAINVLGQANFTSSTTATTQGGMNSPVSLAYDATNSRLFVGQSGNHRVTVYDVASITNGENAINVLGQANFTSSAAATTQGGMNSPVSLAYDATNSRLFVGQSGNNRVTVYDVSSITDGENAINVLGQANFTTSTAATTQAGMNVPQGVAYDATNKKLFVSQQTANRVTVYDVSSITDGENAVNVLGQANFTTGTAATTQAGMSNPRRLEYDAGSGKLYVAENGNNRVVVFAVGCSLAATGTVTNVACYGASTGAINLTVTGGASPYTYNWGGGITTQNRTGLAAGNYTVTVTDASSGTTTASFTITEPASALSVSGTQVNVACFGASTGSINITATGGTGAKTYNWGGGVTTQNRTSLTAGTYTVTVTDANTCTTTASFTITQPPPNAVGDVVFYDTNKNGIKDAGETGVSGITVQLYKMVNGSAVYVRQTVTDANGIYGFTCLDSDYSHFLGVTMPTGYVGTTPELITDDTTDSDINPHTNESSWFIITAGEINITIDIGIALQ